MSRLTRNQRCPWQGKRAGTRKTDEAPLPAGQTHPRVERPDRELPRAHGRIRQTRLAVCRKLRPGRKFPLANPHRGPQGAAGERPLRARRPHRDRTSLRGGVRGHLLPSPASFRIGYPVQRLSLPRRTAHARRHCRIAPSGAHPPVRAARRAHHGPHCRSRPPRTRPLPLSKPKAQAVEAEASASTAVNTARDQLLQDLQTFANQP